MHVNMMTNTKHIIDVDACMIHYCTLAHVCIHTYMHMYTYKHTHILADGTQQVLIGSKA